MPVSKRLKDGIKAYLALLADYRSKEQATEAAKQAETEARRAINDKVEEVLKEGAACASFEVNDMNPDVFVEVDGKLYHLSRYPNDRSSYFPSYIKEIKPER